MMFPGVGLPLYIAGNIQTGLSQVEKQILRFSNRVSVLGYDLQRMTARITAFKDESIAAFSDWESAFAGVRKTVEGLPEQIEALGRSIRDMSLEIPASAVELASIAETAGQLGIARDDVMKFTRVIADMGVATNLAGEEGAATIARLLITTGTASSEVDHLVNTIAALGNAGAATEKEIADMALRIAGTGRLVGLTAGQILAFANSLSSVGIQSELGGSNISKAFMDMSLSVQTGDKKLATFAKTAGMSSAAFQAAFKKDAAGTMVTFLKGLHKQGAAGIVTLKALKLSGAGIASTLQRAAGATGMLEDSLRLETKAWVDNNAATKEADIRYKTFASQAAILKNNITDVRIEMGEYLAPAIQRLNVFMVSWTKAWKSLTEPQKKVVAYLIAAAVSIPPLLIGLGRILRVSVLITEPIKRGYEQLANVIKLLSVVTGGWLSPLLRVIAAGWAVVGVVTAVVAIYQHFGKLKIAMFDFDVVKKGWEDIQAAAKNYWEMTLGFIENFRDNMEILGTWIQENWRAVWEKAGEVLKSIWHSLPNNLMVLLKTFGRLIVTFYAWLNGTATKFWNSAFVQTLMVSVIQGTQKAWVVFKDFMVVLFNAFKETVISMVGLLITYAPEIGKLLRAMITGFGIEDAARDVQKAMVGLGTLVGHKFAEEILRADNAITKMVTDTGKDIAKHWNKAWTETDLIQSIMDVMKEMREEMTNPFSTVDWDIKLPELIFERLKAKAEEAGKGIASGIASAGVEAKETGKALEDMLRPLRKEQEAIGWGSQEMFASLFSQSMKGVPGMSDAAGANAMPELSPSLTDRQEREERARKRLFDLDPRNAEVKAPMYGPRDAEVKAPMVDEGMMVEDAFGPLQGGATSFMPSGLPDVGTGNATATGPSWGDIGDFGASVPSTFDWGDAKSPATGPSWGDIGDFGASVPSTFDWGATADADTAEDQLTLLDEIAVNTRHGKVPEIVIEGALDL